MFIIYISDIHHSYPFITVNKTKQTAAHVPPSGGMRPGLLSARTVSDQAGPAAHRGGLRLLGASSVFLSVFRMEDGDGRGQCRLF